MLDTKLVEQVARLTKTTIMDICTCDAFLFALDNRIELEQNSYKTYIFDL